MRGRALCIRALKRVKLLKCTAGAAQGEGSVFLREHDGEDTLGYGLIRWVGRAAVEIAIVAIDLTEDRRVSVLEAAEVMLAPRIGVRGEIGERTCVVKSFSVVKTRGVVHLWDKSVRCLMTGQTATGVEGA